jgi:outer membrane protein TolC
MIITILTLPVSAAASPAPMGIEEAIDLTLRRNSVLLSLRQEAMKAVAFKLQADGTAAPELGLSAYADVQREIQTSDGSGRRDNRVARISLSQTLYSGGRDEAMRRQSPQVKSMADLTVTDAENRAIGELFARFYNVLLQERRVDTERSAASTSELHLREVSRMSELGLSNRLEVIRAEQQLAANRANLVTAEGLYDSALISLMNYMSIPPEEKRSVTGRLRIMEVSGDRTSSLETAMANRADREMLESQAEYQANQIEIERSGSRPRVSLGASAGYLDPYKGSDFGDETWRAELSITVPILDRGTVKGNVTRAKAVAEQNRIDLKQKELDIKSDVETAWIELESANNRLESTIRALDLAEETLRLAEAGFQEGVTPQLDLLSAQTSLTESRLEHLRSLYNHMLAVVALKVTEGDAINWTGRMKF